MIRVANCKSDRASKAARRNPLAPSMPSVEESPLELALFADAASRPTPAQQMSLFHKVLPVYRRSMARLGIDDADPDFLFGFVLPILRYLTPFVAKRRRPFLIGLAGGPGVGKTTLSALLADLFRHTLMPEPRCLSLSLDDFYFSKEERARRGFQWRTLPGTHDTDRLAQVLKQIDTSSKGLSVPRYDLGADAPLPDERLDRTPDICLFDGAMTGSRLPGYDVLAQRLDILIYLDASLDLLKEWRFSREKRLRIRSNGQTGFAPDKMQAFWSEALYPSVVDYVRPNMAHADLVIELGADRRLEGARVQTASAKGETR